MDIREVKQRLLTDFFTYYPMGGALYDREGALIEINQSMGERFALTDKADFLLNNLFKNTFLSDSQKEHLRKGCVVSDNVPIGFSIIPSTNAEGDRIGYTLLLTDLIPLKVGAESYDQKLMEMEDMSRRVAEAIPDTILLVNDKLVVERVIAFAAETCITPEAVNRRIDDLPGFIYPDETKKKMVNMVRACLDTSQIVNMELSIPGHTAAVVYFKIRMVPVHGRYVVIYIRNVSEQVEKQKENEKLSCQLAENQLMMELALENSRIATYSFNFERFHTCDKEHCNRCFQFHGAANGLLLKNKYICRTLPSLTHPDDKAGFFSLFHTIRDHKLDDYQIDFRLKNDSDDFRVYEVIGKTHEVDAEGYPNLIVGCMIDNQERIEFENDLIMAKEKAEEADALKSSFLANMTHEIRTPLNAIVGFSDLLGMEEDPELRQNYISLIKSNNDLLLGIVNDVLDISRIESDMVVFSYVDIFLPSFMKDLYNTIQPRIAEGVALILDPCPEMIFNIDRARLMQICGNLLTNAAKHTHKGSIRFGYELMRKEQSVRFYVSDTGCGIPKKKQGTVFTRFVQLSDFEQGIGLGLPISKGLVEKMGGTISMASEEGEGSTFEFTLPLKRPGGWKSSTNI